MKHMIQGALLALVLHCQIAVGKCERSMPTTPQGHQDSRCMPA